VEKSKMVFRMQQKLLITLKSQIFKIIEEGHDTDIAYDVSSQALSLMLSDYVKSYVRPDQYQRVLEGICQEAVKISTTTAL
jgi:hypothetical protein